MIPNHAGKRVNNPTAKLIFQHFAGVSIIRMIDKEGRLLSEFMESLNKTQQLILRLLGPPYQALYA